MFKFIKFFFVVFFAYKIYSSKNFKHDIKKFNEWLVFQNLNAFKKNESTKDD